MNLRTVKTQLTAIGITIRRLPDTDEYRVNLKNGSEGTAYYASDLDDALGTGRAMANTQRLLRVRARLVRKGYSEDCVR